MMTGKFGVELECFNVRQDVVAKALNDNGIPAKVASYGGSDYSVFQVKADGSIQGQNGFEVVSPVLEGEEGIMIMRKVCKILADLNAQVNKSTGFHIHHNVRTWGIAEFRNLYKRFVKFETGLDAVQPASRRGSANKYCGSMYGTFTPSAEVQSTIFQKLDTCRTVRQLSEMYRTRYLKLNLQSFFRMGSVEFRNHSGTFDADKVENYIRLTFGMVQDAQDHVAVQKFTADFTAQVALDTLLQGLVRRNRITKEVAKYYKDRAVALKGVA